MLRGLTIANFALLLLISFQQLSSAQQGFSTFQNQPNNRAYSSGDALSQINAVDNVNSSPVAHTRASQLATNPKPYVTRQLRFGVPFDVNENPQNLSEVQLFVSNDRGYSWNLFRRQLPGTREFPFAARGDGEYWFAIKTVDMQKRVKPESNPQAELVVIVDTKNPALSFNVHTDPSGKLVGWWRAVDPNLDPESIKIQYRPHSPFRVNLARWKQASFDPPPATSDGIYEAKATWWPITDSLTIDIQARISDKAGNVSTVDRRVLLSRIVKNPPTPEKKPPAIDPFAVIQERTGQQRAALDEYARRIKTNSHGWQSGTSQFANVRGANSSTKVGLSNGNSDSQNEQFQTNSKDGIASKFVSRPNRLNAKAEATNGGFFRQDWNSNDTEEPDRQTEGQPPGSIAKNVARSNPRNSMLISSGHRTNSGMSNSNGINSKFAVHTKSSESGTETLGQYARHSNHGNAQNRRLSRSRRFNIDYEVDSISPTSVSKVSLWMSKDHGETWYVATQDEDLVSPVVVEVPDDGVYGIRIGVSSREGLAARAPRNPDDADMWSEVDTTNPNVEITSTPYGQGVDAGHLIINWEANDRKLSKNPISLFYSSHPDGPWQSIAASLDNTGNYRWKVSQNVPRRVYLRMEATDVVGNKGVYILDKSIDLAGLIPRGRIRSVTPID